MLKSFLSNPNNPTVCGNAPIKTGEYPLCMPEKQLAKYNKSELGLLVQRKNQIGKRRLVKDAFLRDILEPEKITPIREYKDKYVKEKKNKLPEPLPKAQAEKILKEKPEKEPKIVIEKPVVDLEARRQAKNARQQAAYIPRPPKEDKPKRVPKVKKEKIESETKPSRIKIEQSERFISFN